MPVQNYQHKHKRWLRPREGTARVTREIVLWAWWCLGTAYKSDYGRFSLVKCIKHLLGPWVHTSLISAGIFMKKLQYRWEFEVMFISSMLFQKNTTVTWAKKDQGSPAEIILVNMMCYLIWQAERKGSVIKVVVNRKQNLLIFLQKDTLNEPRTSSIMTWFRSQKAPEQFLTRREWMSTSFVPSPCLWRGWCPTGRLHLFLRISFWPRCKP